METQERPRVLIVDDDVEHTRIIEMAAREAPFDVVSANSGEDALRVWQESLQSRPFAAILLDVMMPGLSGYSVATRVRLEDSKILIGFYTARFSENWRKWARHLNVTAIWHKPVPVYDLMDSMEAWLKGERINVDSAEP